MLRKIFLIPWFGKYPDWLDQWVANMEYLKPYGYDYRIYSNLDLFRERVREVLGVEPSIQSGTGKAWDYRPALGTLFAEDVKGYDYWGHTDFDCVYGDVARFIPDKELKKYDIWTNESRYISGPWTLYRNCPEVNNAFKQNKDWRVKMESPEATGWIETTYSQNVIKNFRVNLCLQQTKDWDNFDTLSFHDGKLYEGDDEVFMAHFRHVKVWPKNIVL